MFRKIFFIILCLFVITALSFQNASAETISWGSSTGVVEGYKVYYESIDGGECNKDNYVNFIDVGNTTSTSTDRLPLSQGVPYCIAVTAYNSAGESGFTESVVWTLGDVTPPLPPIGLKESN